MDYKWTTETATQMFLPWLSRSSRRLDRSGPRRAAADEQSDIRRRTACTVVEHVRGRPRASAIASPFLRHHHFQSSSPEAMTRTTEELAEWRWTSTPRQQHRSTTTGRWRRRPRARWWRRQSAAVAVRRKRRHWPWRTVDDVVSESTANCRQSSMVFHRASRQRTRQRARCHVHR